MNSLLKIVVLASAILAFTVPIVHAKIRSEVVNYQVDNQPFQGYVSYDDAITGKRPGILVVHEWWGQNAYTRLRADRLAKLGYTAFALDMYGTGKRADHPDNAQKFMQATLSDMTAAETRFNAATKWLQQQPTVDPSKIAAIGYCFGGGMVLHMARTGADLLGVVSFHGMLTTQIPAQPGQVKAKILVLNGAEDPFVTPDQIATFKQEMQSAGTQYEFINYPNAKHGFTNPESNANGKRFKMPLAYNAQADKESWLRMQQFFTQDVFK